MKKAPMIALLIVPYATLIICYQANLDITIGLCVYGTLILFNMVYAFLLPGLGFKVKLVDCGWENLKITFPEDVYRAKLILEMRREREKEEVAYADRTRI